MEIYIKETQYAVSTLVFIIVYPRSIILTHATYYVYFQEQMEHKSDY